MGVSFVLKKNWSLWFTAFAGLWALFSPGRVFDWTGNPWPVYASALAVGLGCARLDFRFFFFQAEDGIRDYKVTGVQTCALPICTWGTTPCAVRDCFLCAARW